MKVFKGTHQPRVAPPRFVIPAEVPDQVETLARPTKMHKRQGVASSTAASSSSDGPSQAPPWRSPRPTQPAQRQSTPNALKAR